MTTLKKAKLVRLREVISENLRVQKGSDPLNYISVGTALQDAKAKQNHTIFARRGCGKTLLLHHSARTLKTELKSVYLNCEDFKRHSFPNVLIEILSAIFRELDKNLAGWFGRKEGVEENYQGHPGEARQAATVGGYPRRGSSSQVCGRENVWHRSWDRRREA